MRKITDEQVQYGHDSGQKLSIPIVYEKIKKSNSSLNRKSKKLLEDSVERVLAVLEHESASDDEELLVEENLCGVGDNGKQQVYNDINRSIVGAWSKELPKAAGMQTPSTEEQGESRPATSSKKRSINEGPSAKRRKAASGIDRSPPSHVSLADLGGVDHIIQQLEDLIVLPLLQPGIYGTSKIQPPRGILLHGPPGCGKTMIANAFAAELKVPFIALSAPSIVSGMSGESEKALREHFDEAKKIAPCLIFIDE